MDRVGQVKREVMLNEWVKMVRECQSSGQTVERWCSIDFHNHLEYLDDYLPWGKCVADYFE